MMVEVFCKNYHEQCMIHRLRLINCKLVSMSKQVNNVLPLHLVTPTVNDLQILLTYCVVHPC